MKCKTTVGVQQRFAVRLRRDHNSHTLPLPLKDSMNRLSPYARILQVSIKDMQRSLFICYLRKCDAAVRQRMLVIFPVEKHKLI
jgi:hypothetical protein